MKLHDGVSLLTKFPELKFDHRFGYQFDIQATKKLLEVKDDTIQVLNKKLKVPNVEHAQSSELFALQEEKEKIY